MIKISTFLNIRPELEVIKDGQRTYCEVFGVFFCMFFHTTNLLNLWRRVSRTDYVCFSMCSDVFLPRYLTGIMLNDSIFPYYLYVIYT